MKPDSGIYFRILRKFGHLARRLMAVLTWLAYSPFLRKVGTGSLIHPFASLRNHTNIAIGRNVKVNRNTILWPSQLSIGDNVEINPGVVIYGAVSIAENVLIGPNAVIVGGNHGLSRALPIRLQDSTSKGITIEADVWIGANAVILDGVILGHGSVIAAGAVVTNGTEPFKIYAGVPAKVVSERP